MENNLLILIGIVLTGFFGLSGYLIQRNLERKKELLNQKKEVYSDFFFIMAQASFGKADASDSIHTRTQISVYGSDEVLKAANEFLIAHGKYAKAKTEGVLTEKAIKLIIAMRKDVLPNSKIKQEDIETLLYLG